MTCSASQLFAPLLHRGFYAGLLLSVFGTVGASEQNPDADDGVLEKTRETAYDTSYWLVEHVDQWFGDRPFDEGGRVEGYVGFRALWREKQSSDFTLQGSLNVRMPNLDEKAYLFFGRADTDELLEDQQDTFRRDGLLLPEDEDEQTFFAGLGYFLLDNLDLRLGVRGGYKPYAQARYRTHFDWTDSTRLYFRETIFAGVDRGVGATTALNLDHGLTDRWLLRWQNSATIGTKKSGLGWSSSAGAWYLQDWNKRAWLDLVVRGETGDDVSVSEYGVRANYRHPIARDWLVGEVMVGHFWPRDELEEPRLSSWAVAWQTRLYF